MALAATTKLGPYEIVAPLGAGGMGEVYRALDRRLDRTVAIKVLRAGAVSEPGRRLRFEREARAIAALSHPHICAVHDVGEQDGIPFLVMEYLEGQTLEERLTRGRRRAGSGAAASAAASLTRPPLPSSRLSASPSSSPKPWPQRTRPASSIAISSPRT